jgi:hypothetical protein
MRFGKRLSVIAWSLAGELRGAFRPGVGVHEGPTL